MHYSIVIFLWSLVSLLLFQGRKKIKVIEHGVKIEQPNILFCFISALPLIYYAGTRGYITDTTAYIIKFYNMPTTFRDFIRYITFDDTKYIGFSMVTMLIKKIIGPNMTLYLLLIASFQVFCVIRFFRRYSTQFSASYFFFIASADYLAWLFNGIRQFTAVCILLLGVNYYLDKKFIKALIVIYIASLFHSTALIMIPIIVIGNGRAFNRKTLFFIMLILFSMAFVDRFTSLLDNALEETLYANVVNEYTALGDDGTHPLRVVLYSVPAISAFIYRKRIKAENNVLISFSTNMAIITMGLYLLSMVTSGLFFGRLPIYTSLFGYILIPWIVKYAMEKRYKPIYVSGLFVTYLVFYWYSLR